MKKIKRYWAIALFIIAIAIAFIMPSLITTLSPIAVGLGIVAPKEASENGKAKARNEAEKRGLVKKLP